MNITLEDLGYKHFYEDFCPSIMWADYANEYKFITFWKDGEVACYTRKNEEYTSLSFEEAIACANLIKEKGWCD